ncbi:glycosyltransferase family 2 protein [Candidatus Amesbacteria bacterium]|nr:glycosyltransferase family 2 protein [Candidatus Amesbacteria bacterium]
MKTPIINVITISFNCKMVLFRALDSLLKSKHVKYQIIVVDNGSSDGTLKEGLRKYKTVKWIDAGEKNIGWGGSYNLGISKSDFKSDVVIFDSDVVATPSLLQKLSEAAYRNQSIGIVTPMILYLGDHNWVNQAGAEVDLLTGLTKIGWGSKKDFQKSKIVQNSGTVLYIKRDVIGKIGGFDNWFIGYLDPDYCLRAKKAGFLTWYESLAVAYHDQSKGSDDWTPRLLKRSFITMRNRILFMRRHSTNIIIFVLILFPLTIYYTYLCLRYQNIYAIWELFRGVVAGFTYKLTAGNKIDL